MLAKSPTVPKTFVAALDEERSYWQPQPANGYVTVKLSPSGTGSPAASMGVQSVAPGGYVREHSHAEQEEIIFVFGGSGKAIVDGSEYAMTPGATFFMGRGVRHSFVNTGSTDLQFTWTIMPGSGLDEFFAAIGRPRRPGQPTPEPFARPADVSEIERRTGFNASR